MKRVAVVAAALVNEAGEVLLAQRPEGKSMAGLWEFPGGKLEDGETPEVSLVRELREELGIAARPEDLQPISFVSYAYADFHLVMLLYGLTRWQGTAQGLEGQALQWVKPERLPDIAMPPADEPLIDCLRDFLLKIT